MAVTPYQRLRRMPGRFARRRVRGYSPVLYWRVFAVNATVLTVAVLLIAVTPFAVSRDTTPGQLAVLLVGLVAMLAANAVLLRVGLAPLRRLIGLMRRVDLLQPGNHLHASGSSEIAEVIAVFNGMLARLEEERRSSMRRELLAQEAERGRIAQELHDQLGQDMTAILLDAERLAGQLAGGRQQLADAVARGAKDVLDELRRISYELRPAALDDLGLASAIEALRANVAHHSQLAIRLEIDPPLPAMDGDVELAIFRITQEALTNAVRHSGCDTVAVRLGERNGSLDLEVIDDGSGIAGARAGGGIRGMRERAHMIGGTLNVDQSESGTSVRLRLPLRIVER